MAERRDEAAAGLLLSVAPPFVEEVPLVAEVPRKPAKAAGRSRKSKDARTLLPAADKPIARIAVDQPLPHLDRPFDYLVPERLADQARPGVRVRVRFAGKLTDGYLIERAGETEHQGNLRYLDKVVSAEQVLTEEIAGLARAVADRYAGTLADVLRLAIPPRHAATEAEPSRGAGADAADVWDPTAPVASAGVPSSGLPPTAVPSTTVPPRPDPGPWARYPAGPSFLNALAAGRPVRAAWSAIPGGTWPEEIARAAVTAASAGRGTVIVVPDGRDLARVGEALAALLHAAGPAAGGTRHVTLTADLGPAERYRRWLAVLRGEVMIVAGTRAAMFAPVRDLGLVVLWDDGDDLHADPRAPYPNAREVLALRAHRCGAAALIGGFARSTELTQLVAAGWARPLGPDRQTLRAAAPRVRPAADEAELAKDGAAMIARLPALSLRTARAALADGPVLVQVPRRGYLAGIACARCRAQARCTRLVGQAGTQCNGPLRLTGPRAVPDCRWCGALATTQDPPGQDGAARVGPGLAGRDVAGRGPVGRDTGAGRITGDRDHGGGRTGRGQLGMGAGGWRCAHCGHDRLRATVVGAARTAEELGRAFPGVSVRTSGGDLVLPRVTAEPALVIATPGAEPVADYAAALLLDGWALLSRPSLRAAEEALRRWLAAAALVRPGGTVVLHADAALPATQALVRWDPVTFAERDLGERVELGFPPAVRMAVVSGAAAAVAGVIDGLDPEFEVLGPVPVEQPWPARQDHPAAEQLVRALVRAPRSQGAALAKALQAAQAGRSARKEGGGVRVQLDPIELL